MLVHDISAQADVLALGAKVETARAAPSRNQRSKINAETAGLAGIVQQIRDVAASETEGYAAR